MISFHDTFLPYISMPVRYTLPASQVNMINVTNSSATDVTTCPIGTPNGMRSIMATGEVNGIIDNQILIELSGAFAIMVEHTIGMMRSIEMGVTNCWVSVSLSTAEPTAANIAE